MTTYVESDVIPRREGGGHVDGSVATQSEGDATPAARSMRVDRMLNDSFPASDPPSSTASIWRVTPAEPRHINEPLVRRVRAEFMEMPGLSLTLEQAQRLWSLEQPTCEALLKSLTDSRFLHRTRRGLFVLHATRV